MSTDRLTEILNYLSAMSRDIGAFRTETNSRFDALETRVGRIETHLDSLEERVSRFEGSMNARFEAMNVRFDEFRSDVRRLTRKFDVVTEDLLELRTDYRELDKRVEALERKTGITDTA